MKRYQLFNNQFGASETIEEMAVGMLLTTIADTYGVEHMQNDVTQAKLIERFNIHMKWLNEEVGK